MERVDTATLMAELEQFRREKEQIRTVMGQVGGKATARRDRIVNLVFVVAIVALFSMDVLRHLLGYDIPLPPLFSIEVGLLMVSVKIIWMIHKQSKVEHFQFWILNSIEFRVNDVAKRLRALEDRLE
jgi:uncharacterized membrane protein